MCWELQPLLKVFVEIDRVALHAPMQLAASSLSDVYTFSNGKQCKTSLFWAIKCLIWRWHLAFSALYATNVFAFFSLWYEGFMEILEALLGAIKSNFFAYLILSSTLFCGIFNSVTLSPKPEKKNWQHHGAVNQSNGREQLRDHFL